MILHAQNYLRAGKTLDDLKKKHGINYNIRNGKVSLSYDMLNAVNADPVSQQCRGLILRENTWDIVAVPMFRFFNLEQKTDAVSIDWASAQYEEKMDGTLIIVYFDTVQNKWFVATRSVPEADIKIDTYSVTFSELFEVALSKIFTIDNFSLQDFMKNASKNKTYCFELCTPLNRIVCQYDNFEIVLLSVRSLLTLEEENPELSYNLFSMKEIKKYKFDNIANLTNIIREWDPKKHEGVVVKDKSFNRVKVKSPAYIAYNHMRDSLTTSVRGCVETVLLGKDDDVIGMLPEFLVERLLKIKEAVKIIVKNAESDYESIKHIETQKDFAIAAGKRIWPSVLFSIRNGKNKNISEFIKHNSDSKSFQYFIFKKCLEIDPTIQ